MKMHQVTVTVAGEFPFPIDMLRYDALWPKTELCSHTIQRTFTEDVPRSRPLILLTGWKERKTWLPNAARWKSMGWEVKSVEWGATVL